MLNDIMLNVVKLNVMLCVLSSECCNSTFWVIIVLLSVVMLNVITLIVLSSDCHILDF
jgi:hypothetical protein